MLAHEGLDDVHQQVRLRFAVGETLFRFRAVQDYIWALRA